MTGSNTEGGYGWFWVILIFLFFLGFSGGGLGGFGGNGAVAASVEAINLTNLERDVLNGNFATQRETLENRYTTQLGFQNLGSQMAQCCCETNRNIDAVRYENAKNTCDIIQAGNANTQRIVDVMTNNTIQELRDSLQQSQLNIGNLIQTQTITNSLRPFPVPAYITCSPYTSGSSCIM